MMFLPKQPVPFSIFVLFITAMQFIVTGPASADEFVKKQNNALQQFEVFYEELLQTYWRPSVRINGIMTTVFDYSSMVNDANHPNSLFAKTVNALASVDARALPRSDQTKAFWINVYNFGAMRMIVDHYPVDSITSFKISLLKHPWSKKTLRVGRQYYSLSEIEKDILLKEYDDPRIVLAVSCAAVSCPDRTAHAFSGERLDDQLDSLIRVFFSNPDKGLLLNREQGSMTLAWILKKDAHLFAGDVMAFVTNYLSPDIQSWLKRNSVKIGYFDHDWTLNDLAQAE